MKKLFLLGLALLALLAVLSWTVTTYHATCAGCLAKARGREVSLLGITFSKSLSIKHEPDHPEILEDGPETFKRITGHDCRHQFKKGGIGWSAGGMIACGGSSEGLAFAPRSDAVASLFRLFKRLPVQSLARDNYEWIDGELPSGIDVRSALAYRRDGLKTTPLGELAQMLDLVSTEDEWKAVLSYVKGRLKGQPPLLNDLVVLKNRSASPSPEIHRTASLRLMELDHAERWNHISASLEDKDGVVVQHAVRIIQDEHRLELFGRMLRLPHEHFYRETFVASVSDEDIAALIGSEDDVVATFCHEAITSSYRFQFLEVLIDSLNHRFNQKRLDAANDLLAGPKVFDGKTDPWAELESFDGPVEEAVEIVSKGPSARMRNTRSHLFLNACKALAQSGKKSHWLMLHDIYVDSVAGGGFNQAYAAIISRAMAALDAPRTEVFLLGEFALGDKEAQRLTCTLASMGLVANPSFLEPVRKFQFALPPQTKDFSSQHVFHNPYYRRYLEYAAHRCAGIHLRQVCPGAGGKYVIEPSL